MIWVPLNLYVRSRTSHYVIRWVIISVFLPTSEPDLALPNVLQNTSLKSIWLHLWTDDPRPGPISIKKGPNVDMDESILSDNWTRPRTYMLSASNAFFFSNTVEVVYYISNDDTVAKEQKHRH